MGAAYPSDTTGADNVVHLDIILFKAPLAMIFLKNWYAVQCINNFFLTPDVPLYF